MLYICYIYFDYIDVTHHMISLALSPSVIRRPWPLFLQATFRELRPLSCLSSPLGQPLSHA